jgi:hypothetical protein
MSYTAGPQSFSGRTRGALTLAVSGPSPPPTPLVELCVIHCFEEIAAVEATLDLALVAMVGGHRQLVSTSAIKLWL